MMVYILRNWGILYTFCLLLPTSFLLRVVYLDNGWQRCGGIMTSRYMHVNYYTWQFTSHHRHDGLCHTNWLINYQEIDHILYEPCLSIHHTLATRGFNTRICQKKKKRVLTHALVAQIWQRSSGQESHTCSSHIPQCWKVLSFSLSVSLHVAII